MRSFSAARASSPRQCLVASGAADPVRLGELQQRRDRFDLRIAQPKM